MIPRDLVIILLDEARKTNPIYDFFFVWARTFTATLKSQLLVPRTFQSACTATELLRCGQPRHPAELRSHIIIIHLEGRSLLG